MVPSLWELIFSEPKYPITLKQKLACGFRDAGRCLFFGTVIMIFTIILALAFIVIVGTMRYWPPFLALITLLGFLHGFGAFRPKRLPRRE